MIPARLFALALAAATPSIAILEPATAQSVGTLPDAYAGLSPAQARDLRATIERMSRERDVREATLTTIASRLRVSLGDTSFAQLIELVEARAVEAETLRAELSLLQTRFESISNQNDRNFVQDTLARAQSAFDQGLLSDADAILAQLAPTSGEALRVRLEDWQDVVAARAQVMLVDGRLTESVAYRRQIIRAQQEIANQAYFQIMLRAAHDLYSEGNRLGNINYLRDSIDAYNNDVLSIASRESAPENWALACYGLGIAFLALSQQSVTEHSVRYRAGAISALELSLTVFSQHSHPNQWLAAKNTLATAISTIDANADSEERIFNLNSALEIYYEVLEFATDVDNSDAAFEANASRAGVMVSLGLTHEGAQRERYLLNAINIFDDLAEECSYEIDSISCYRIKQNQGVTYLTYGVYVNPDIGREVIYRAIEIHEDILSDLLPEDHRAFWRDVKIGLGTAYVQLGERSASDEGLDYVVRGLENYQEALSITHPDTAPQAWASINMNMGHAYTIILRHFGHRVNKGDYARLATEHYTNTLSIYPQSAALLNRVRALEAYQ